MSEPTTQSQSLSASRMGTAPVGPLLLRNSIPMVISMLVQALYNVVDSIFVSRIDEAALSAVSLAFPMQNLMIAFAVGTAVGVNAYLARSLGEKNQAEADRAATNGVFLSFCSCAAFVLFGVVGVHLFFRSQTSDAHILAYGSSYLTICCVFSLGLFVQCMLEKVLVATGRSSMAMLTQLAGAITNIILDPLLIFGLLGLPKMGIAGAAVATVLGQTVGAALALFLNLTRNTDVHLRLRGFRPNAHTILQIYAVGVPSIAMNAIGSVMTFAMNLILIGFSSTAVAVFGVYFKLQSFVFMPVFGLNNGMVPIVSYNLGARHPARIRRVIHLSVLYAEGIMLLGFLAAQFFPNALLGAFNASPDMLALGRTALRIISIHFLIAGYDVILSSAFQALGHGFLALLVAIGRQLVVLVPAAYLLSLSGRVELVWWAFPIAEVLSAALCTVFFRKVKREVIRPMEQQPA